MALANDYFKWLYVFEPHTASRATQNALLKHVPHTQQASHHHATFREMVTCNRTGKTPFERFFGYHVICTVRNPFSVLVTGYHREHAGKSFSEWLDVMLNCPRAQVPLHRGLWQDASTFVYYEHLQEDLNWVMGRDVPLEYWENHKTEGKKPWQEYYTLDQINRLLMFWQPFLDHFGYYFHEDQLLVDKDVRLRRTKQIGHDPRLLTKWR